jgi:hypothetical protein
MVGDTGLELANASGHVSDTFVTKSPQTEARTQVRPEDNGQFETRTGQQKDTFGACPCCAGVAQNRTQSIPLDLLRLAMLWEGIPIGIRQGWIVTAETIVEM